MAAALLFVFHFHLVPGLVAGLLVQVVLHKLTGLLHGPRLSRGMAKILSLALVGIVAGGVTAGAVALLIGFFRGHLGDLPDLFRAMAVALEKVRSKLGDWGFSAFLPASLEDAESLQKALSNWFREHAVELRTAGGAAGRFALHSLMGIVISLLIFFRHGAGEAEPRPFAAALLERAARLATAFEMVVLAQIEISAVNTVLTGIYLFGVLPLLSSGLPFSGTVLAVTFVAGLIPVVGNLVSNSIIVILSLSLSPWTGLLSLGFLLVIHKLEYLMNAKIVGARIGAAAWETLLAIIVFEVAFDIPGVVMAPVIYAYLKKELTDHRLV
jgi:predicted PurR-regulated permease PerM